MLLFRVDEILGFLVVNDKILSYRSGDDRWIWTVVHGASVQWRLTLSYGGERCLQAC